MGVCMFCECEKEATEEERDRERATEIECVCDCVIFELAGGKLDNRVGEY